MADIPCVRCGKPIPPERHCYAIPTCYACLPPPSPLETIAQRAAGFAPMTAASFTLPAPYSWLAHLEAGGQRPFDKGMTPPKALVDACLASYARQMGGAG